MLSTQELRAFAAKPVVNNSQNKLIGLVVERLFSTPGFIPALIPEIMMLESNTAKNKWEHIDCKVLCENRSAYLEIKTVLTEFGKYAGAGVGGADSIDGVLVQTVKLKEFDKLENVHVLAYYWQENKLVLFRYSGSTLTWEGLSHDVNCARVSYFEDNTVRVVDNALTDEHREWVEEEVVMEQRRMAFVL